MNRRQFLKGSGYAAFGLALTNSNPAASFAAERRDPKWSITRRPWDPIGPLDLLELLGPGQQWANNSLIKYGTVEPPNGGSRGRTMRSACMPAESCAHYYAMTGDKRTLKALESAVATFRKYRHKARARRIPYEGLAEPPAVEYEAMPEKSPTIEYEMISCHVGRNMRGMRAAAHILKDAKLLAEVAEELNWWIDNPLGFNREKHFFDARIFLDENGKTIGSEKRYTFNMGGSLACAMWLVGDDLDDRRMKQYAEEQILQGIVPHQLDNGYFPYGLGVEYELIDGIAIESNYYHSLTLQVLSPLLAYKRWQTEPAFVAMMRRGCRYIGRLTMDTGEVKHPGRVDIARLKKKNFCPRPNWGTTSGSALIHTRLYKYLGDRWAFEQAARNLRWLYWNAPACIPFLPTNPRPGMQHILTEWGFSHSFRHVVLTAYEGMHLKQLPTRDVQPVFVQPA